MNKLNWWTSLNISTEQHTRPNKVSVSLWCTCTRAHTVSVLILLLITYKWLCSPKPTTEPWPYHKIQAQQKNWCHSQIIFDSVQLHRRQPIRLPHPWDSPGKNTGVGCHFLLQCIKVKSEVTQSLSRVRLIVTPWTSAYQAPPSMGFSSQEFWSGVPLPSPITVLRS